MLKYLALSTLLSTSLFSLAQSNPDLSSILEKIDVNSCGNLAVAWIDGDDSGRSIIANDTLVNAESLYEIGSITKGITGIALAQLVLEGQVSLNDKLVDLLDFEGDVDRLKDVTLEDLATHTSGLPRIPNLGVIYAIRNNKDPYAAFDEAKLQSVMPKTKLFKPGEANYSNLGFGLLGMAIANVQNQDYTTFIEQSVLQPLGMSNSIAGNTFPENVDVAPVYKKNCKQSNLWTIQNTIAGAGAVKSNLDDMTVLMEALLKPEQSSLNEAIQFATEPRQKFDETSQVGLGWMTTTKDSNDVLWHNGGTGSSTSFIGINKAKNRAVLLMFNKPMYEQVTAAGMEYLMAK